MAKKRKQYSPAARANYHKRRMNNSAVSEGKRVYSKNWVEGFTDSHAKTNYNAVLTEISAKKGRMSKDYAAVLYGYKNGLKAQLEKK